MTGVLCVVAGMGSRTETQTVTVGSIAIKGFVAVGFQDGSFGSISDGTFGFISDAPITALSWNNSDNAVVFTLSGNRANSGWINMRLSGVDYTRASAAYTYDGGGDTTEWRWTSPGTNPFGADGSSADAVFTA
jgi:hypothetical protein